jgi:hypothetical protein
MKFPCITSNLSPAAELLILLVLKLYSGGFKCWSGLVNYDVDGKKERLLQRF